MAIHKKITKDNELYVYMNGKIIYKRWLNTGQSKVFDIMAYDEGTFLSIVEGKNGEIRKRRRIIINGYYCNTQEDFWNKYTNQISSKSAMGFGKNLDSFNDAITGAGPGFPGDCLIEIIGIEQLTKLFGSQNMEFIIQLLQDAEYIDLVIESK